MKAILSDALDCFLSGCPVAWDIIEDGGIADDKLKFIWDYVITKRPFDYGVSFGWRFRHQVDYVREYHSYKGVIDCPVKEVFHLVQSGMVDNGWSELKYCFYIDGSYVCASSKDYDTELEAYLELIYNWYTLGCY